MSEDQEFLSMFDEEIVELARDIFEIEPPANIRYDEPFNKGVQRIVTEVLWAEYCGYRESALNLDNTLTPVEYHSWRLKPFFFPINGGNSTRRRRYEYSLHIFVQISLHAFVKKGCMLIQPSE
jgi:hypothetical protein